MESKRVLMIVGDYVEDYEAMVPFQIMTMFGHTVEAVCPGKRTGEKVITAIHDFEGQQTYSEKPGHYFTLTADFESVDPTTHDGLYLPGGRAPEYLRLNGRVIEHIQHFGQADKPIAAICHGVQLLTGAGLVSGRQLTAYPACQTEVLAGGGRWIEPGAGMDVVHRDGNLLSAPAWPANALLTKAFLQCLGGYPQTAG